MEADLARSFTSEFSQAKAKLSRLLAEMIERGQKISATEYDAAVAKIADYAGSLDEIFESYDAILTPASLGPAPEGLADTGSPVMNTIWTLCGTPALNLPLLQDSDGLPFGVQLVGAKGDDARLFRTSRWLLKLLKD